MRFWPDWLMRSGDWDERQYLSRHGHGTGQISNRHKVRGCALCEASAALIAGNAAGMDRPALQTARQNIEAIVRRGEDMTPVWADMAAFAPVHSRKSRQDCVLLPFDALDAALSQLKE